VKGEVKLREAKATTLRRVLLTRSCAMEEEDVVGEVKGIDEAGVRFACRGPRSRGDMVGFIRSPRCVEGIEGARLRLTRSATCATLVFLITTLVKTVTVTVTVSMEHLELEG